MSHMDRLVLVPAARLDDLLELAGLAAQELEVNAPNDPLASALRGSIAEIRTHGLLEPAAA